MKALFVGRFQPFHIGHLSSLFQMKRDGCNEIVIGIGSSQLSGTGKNPFTGEERKEMLEAVLDNHRELDCKVIFIPDINNCPKWVGHTENILKENGINHVDVVYTNNSIVKELFEKAKYMVVEPELLKRGSEAITATMVRTMIAKGDESWTEIVPEEVRKKIVKFDGINRIKRVFPDGLSAKKMQ